MSADRHPSQTPEPQTDRAQSSPAATDVELEFRSAAASGSTTNASAPPLSHRIEQTKLRARVTALERALETSESRQQEIVTQYERLLAERDETTQDGANAAAATDDGLLKRLLERWR